MADFGNFPALSVRQPWAELILRGEKKIEIRGWETYYRGFIYLHAGGKPYGHKLLEYNMKHVFRGGYVGIIEIKAIVPFTRETWSKWKNMHLSSNNYRDGLFAWIIENPQRLKMPIVGNGKIGLYYPSRDILFQLQNQ